MGRFNGKATGEAETASEMTSATKVTKKSALSKSPDREAEYDGTINDRD
jgi:hypothetical protein